MARTHKRKPINRSDLNLLVDAEVMGRVTTRQTFTAYGITLALRAVNPGLTIMHNEVRPLVHDLMATLNFLHHPYQLEWRAYNGVAARTYVPYDIIMTGVSDDPQGVVAGPLIDWDT